MILLAIAAYIIIVSVVAYRSTHGHWPDVRGGIRQFIGLVTIRNLTQVAKFLAESVATGIAVGLVGLVMIKAIETFTHIEVPPLAALMFSFFIMGNIDQWRKRRRDS